MLNVYDIRLEAIQDHNRQDHDLQRYKNELKSLAHDVGNKISSEDDFELLYLYRRVKRELSFITGSNTIRA